MEFGKAVDHNSDYFASSGHRPVFACGIGNVDLAPTHPRRQALLSLTKEFYSGHSASLRIAGLLGIIAFSFWAGMSPHWGYPYPLHVDEWFAIGYAQSTLEAGGLEYPNPYRGGEISFHPEMGFHLILAFLKTVTGLSWMGLYRFAPGVMLALLSLFTYSFGRKAGFGWAAALLVSLIPTSVRTLGPAFVVPVSAAMLFIPLTLLILHSMGESGRGKSLWILTLLMAGAIFVHPPTEAVITALAILYLTGFILEALAQRRYGEGVKLFLAIGVRISIPALVLGLWLPSLSKKALQQVTTSASSAASPGDLSSGLPLGVHTGFFEAFGILAVALFVFGIFLFVARSDFGIRSYMLPIFAGLLLAYLVFFFPAYQLGLNILYYRGWSYLGLLMAIFGGYGIAVFFRSIPDVAKTLASRFRGPVGVWTTGVLWVVGPAVIIFVLVTGPVFDGDRSSYAGYYHVLNRPMFADFGWMGQHTLPEQTVAMGEPTLAWAYPPSAGPGTEVWEAISEPGTNRRVEKVREMMESGEADVPWLRQSGISVFYTCLPQTFTCEEFSNSDLFKVSRGVYVITDPTDKR